MYVHKLNFKEVHTHDCARIYPQTAYGPGRTQANNVMCEIEKRDMAIATSDQDKSEMEYAIEQQRENGWNDLPIHKNDT